MFHKFMDVQRQFEVVMIRFGFIKSLNLQPPENRGYFSNVSKITVVVTIYADDVS